jgi:WD40 repeat protein
VGDLRSEVERALRDPSKRIGRYVVLSELGRGAMGVVLRAFDPTVGRPVAIKLILDPGAAASIERFRREVTSAGRLRHPGIVAIHDSGEHQGRPFLVMELVEGGESFATLLERRAVDERRALEIVRAVALALEHAHGHGVVHRDVKPANVLVEASGTPRLSDFGLARDTRAQASLTKTGDVLGTPSFMAPEQAGGESSKTHGPPVDVYALGVILYLVLTGVLPFRAATPHALTKQILLDAPEPPRRLVPGIDRGLEALVLRCLEKEPERRPAAGEVARVLGLYLDGKLEAPRRAPWKVALAAGAVLALGGAGAVVVLGRTSGAAPAGPPSPPAERPVEPAPPDPYASLRHSKNGLATLGVVMGGYDWKDSGGIECVAATADGKTVLTGDGNGRLTLRHLEWDRAPCVGRVLHTWKPHQRWVHAVALSPDGKRAVSGSLDSSLFVWDWKGSIPEPTSRALDTGGRSVLAVALSGDGEHVIAGTAGGSVLTWDLRAGSASRVLVTGISDDGKNGARLLEPDPGPEPNHLVGDIAKAAHEHGSGFIAGVAFLRPDGSKAIVRTSQGTLTMWDLARGEPNVLEERGKVPLRESRYRWVGFSNNFAVSRDGTTALAASVFPDDEKGHGTLTVWDLVTGTMRAEIQAHDRATGAVAFVGERNDLAVSTSEGEVKVWRLASSPELLRTFGPKNTVPDLPESARAPTIFTLVAPDERRVLFVTSGLVPFDLKFGKDLREHPLTPRFQPVAVSNDGRVLAGGEEGGELGSTRQFSLDTGSELTILRARDLPQEWIRGVAFSSDSKLAFAAGTHGQEGGARVVAFNVEDGSVHQKFAIKKNTPRLSALDVSQDGSRILIGFERGALGIFRQEGDVVRELRGHPGEWVSCVRFAPDERSVLSSAGRVVKQWSVDETGSVSTYEAPSDVRAFALVGEGPSEILAGCSDGSLCAWSFGQRSPPRTSRTRPSGILSYGLAVSPDGRRAVASCEDGKVRLYSTETLEPLDEIDLARTLDCGNGVAFAPDGRSFVVATERGVVFRFDLDAKTR